MGDHEETYENVGLGRRGVKNVTDTVNQASVVIEIAEAAATGSLAERAPEAGSYVLKAPTAPTAPQVQPASFVGNAFVPEPAGNLVKRNLLLEADYPHLDSTWPNTQAVVDEAIGTFPAEEIRKITWENASNLFQHPVPASVAADPESY